MASSSLNHGLVDDKEYVLNLGTSFQPRKADQSFHLMRYDFKPSSVDSSRLGEVQIGSNNECTVTIPNTNDSTTTYKGGKKPCTKECVLIIDKKTGEITLERISSNIPLKKSRTSSTHNKSKLNPATKQACSQGSSVVSSQSQKLPSNPSSQNSTQHNSSLTGSPGKQKPQTIPTTPNQLIQPTPLKPNQPVVKAREMSTTSTSESSSSDSSDSDSETEKEMAAHIEDTFSTKPYQPPPPTKCAKTGSFSTLQTDLQLSDSNESDSE